MSYVKTYEEETLSRDAVEQRPGTWVLEFGANWCGHCIAAQKDIETVLASRADVNHEKIADGPGRLDVLIFPGLQDLAPDQPGHAEPRKDRQGQREDEIVHHAQADDIHSQ